MPFNVLAIGASRNIGYWAALYLLDSGHNVTFLLRRKTTFDQDTRMQSFIQSGQAKLVFGTAISAEDVKKALEVAAQNGDGNGKVDYFLCTVGGKPEFSLKKGLAVDNPFICSQTTRAILSALSSSASSATPTTPTKLIVVTSNGVTTQTHDALPFLLKPFYTLLLTGAHKDKRATEHLLSASSSNSGSDSDSDSFACTPKEITSLEKSGHLFPGWKEIARPSPSNPLETLVIRPSLLTDGIARAESSSETASSSSQKLGSKAFRTGAVLPGAWNVSRKDVGWFIAKSALSDWDSWKGKAVVISY